MTRPRTATAHLRLDEISRGPDTARRVRDGLAKRIVLFGEAIDYRLIRARRRTIGMEVDLEGLTVRAPRWVTLGEIEAALAERAKWLVQAPAGRRAPRRRRVTPRRKVAGAQP